MWNVPPAYASKATKPPRGAWSGRAGSSRGWVRGVAVPPAIGNDQRTPCRSKTIEDWSGETVAAMFVPRLTLISRGEVAHPGAARVPPTPRGRAAGGEVAEAGNTTGEMDPAAQGRGATQGKKKVKPKRPPRRKKRFRGRGVRNPAGQKIPRTFSATPKKAKNSPERWRGTS